jgi:hypothetical protein
MTHGVGGMADHGLVSAAITPSTHGVYFDYTCICGAAFQYWAVYDPHGTTMFCLNRYDPTCPSRIGRYRCANTLGDHLSDAYPEATVSCGASCRCNSRENSEGRLI